jgi:hypothetical protein
MNGTHQRYPLHRKLSEKKSNGCAVNFMDDGLVMYVRIRSSDIDLPDDG